MYELFCEASLATNPDYSQGSEHGRGHQLHLAVSPTTKLSVPWIPLTKPASLWLIIGNDLFSSFRLCNRLIPIQYLSTLREVLMDIHMLDGMLPQLRYFVNMYVSESN